MKLQDYAFSINVRSDPSLVDFITDINTILNNGRYQMRISTTVPNWVGDDGEHLMYINGTTRRLYVYDATNSTWQYIEWTSGGGAVSGDKILDNAGTTGIYTQFVANEQTLRFYINGVYFMSLNASGLSLNSDTPISFNGLNGNTQVKYNSSSGYLEFYIGGTLRVQM